jgi:hypothetical protein
MANIKTSKTKFPVRLQRAIQDCERYCKPMLERNNIVWSKYAANYYKEISTEESLRLPSSKARPINMIFRFVNIMMSYLAQYMPKTRVTPKGNPLYRSMADMLGMALTHVKKEIAYRDTFRAVVRNALTYMGAIKIGMCPGAKIEYGGETHQMGQIYADVIHPSDLVFDVGARRKSDLIFIGNKYRLPLSFIRESGLFKNFDRIQRAAQLYGDPAPEQVAKAEIKGQQYHELYEMGELYDIYMVNEGLLITIPAEGEGEKIMRRVEFLPESGPYELLSFHDFEGSILPVPPVHTALDLDEAVNRLARKLNTLVEGQKTIATARKGGQEDADTIKNARHGAIVLLTDPDGIAERTFGGPDQNTMAALNWYENQYSQQLGNLDILGGLRTQAGTLGQERMLASNAQSSIQDMYECVMDFAMRVESKMAWYMLADPYIQIPMIKEIPGVPGGLALTYSNDVREGDYLDYNFDVVPYSSMGISPSEAYQQLLSAVNQIVIPFIQTASQQGMVVDVQKLASIASQYLDSDDLVSIFRPADKAEIIQNPGPYPQPLQGQKLGKNIGGQYDGRLGIKNDVGASINAELRNEKNYGTNSQV